MATRRNRQVAVQVGTAAGAARAALRRPSGKRNPKKGADYRHERGGKFAKGGAG